MIATDTRSSVGVESPSRRGEEIQLLEGLWATSAPTRRVRRLVALPRFWPAALLGIAWIVVLGTLFGLAPAADPAAATPAWMEHATGAMFTALLFTSFGFASRVLGYGASGIAAMLGTSLGIGCYGMGHGGFWPAFQVAGFVTLLGLSALGVMHSRRRRRR